MHLAPLPTSLPDVWQQMNLLQLHCDLSADLGRGSPGQLSPFAFPFLPILEGLFRLASSHSAGKISCNVLGRKSAL